jgi:hypothetical protein
MFERIKAILAAGVAFAFVLGGSEALAAPAEKEVVVINAPSEPVPVTVEGQPRTPISASGEWQGAGLPLPASTIVHDFIFYAESLGDQPSCRFAMDFVIDNTNSRRLRRFDLAPTESVELHYEAGVDTDDLRFGTVMDAGTSTPCVIHWALFGFDVP